MLHHIILQLVRERQKEIGVHRNGTGPLSGILNAPGDFHQISHVNVCDIDAENLEYLLLVF